MIQEFDDVYNFISKSYYEANDKLNDIYINSVNKPYGEFIADIFKDMDRFYDILLRDIDKAKEEYIKEDRKNLLRRKDDRGIK